MASDATLNNPAPVPSRKGAALQHSTWRRRSLLSRGLAQIERFLGHSGFDRAPWLSVAFGTGIALWFALPSLGQWIALTAAGVLAALSAMVLLRAIGPVPLTRRALIGVGLMLSAGCVTVWAKSAIIGQDAIERPVVSTFVAQVLERQEQPARDRVRLVLATREPGTSRPIKVRVNVPEVHDSAQIVEGARIKLRARLMPPAAPMLPGGYNFARTAWFAGLAATGSALGPVTILEPAGRTDFLSSLQTRLSDHVRKRLLGPEGAIAATLASGDRGALGEDDSQAMRDAGLAHLLSISGLHVSAVIAVTYVLAIRFLALWPAVALRWRLPLLAAGAAALTGIGYTLLTGAQVPTVRSCIGALLVLAAVAMGRDALSLRVLAVAAFVVLLLWPESIMGPSFQMSFAAVMAIIALNTSETVQRFLAPREEGLGVRSARYVAMLFLTGLVIEFVLMPIGLYHFHRAGIYGAFANVIAIPLTTLIVMPLIAFALLLDSVGAGAPAWWMAGKAIAAILGLAHWISDRPGAVSVLPSMGGWRYGLFLAGGLWLALWNARIRMLGLIPAAFGILSLFALRPPDLLVSGDGRHVGITGTGQNELLVLRDTRSDFVRDNLTELAGMDGMPLPLAQWRHARCNRDFCAVRLKRGDKDWHILIARSHERVPERGLAAACERSDIVIADRYLPRSCKPRWMRADRRMLDQTGGLAIDLAKQKITTVADGQGDHGWWRGG